MDRELLSNLLFGLIGKINNEYEFKTKFMGDIIVMGNVICMGGTEV